MVTANSVKFSSVTYKIFASNTGEPSRSTFDAQSLLFGLRPRHYCGNTIISFVLLSVGTSWAAKHRTKVHHWAKTSRLPSTWSSDTYDLFWCLSSTPRNHVTWRHFWNGSIQYSCLIYAARDWQVSYCVRGFSFYGGKKTRVHYVCLVLIVQVGRWLAIFLWGRGYIFCLSCCTASAMRECARK